MALSQAQINMLKGLPGIDQNLLSAYQKEGQNLTAEEKNAINNADTSPENLAKIASQSFVTPANRKAIPAASAITVPTNEKVSSLTNFSNALQEAVSFARAQRQNQELDFLGGVIPKGAVSAGQFTGLLANLNEASSNFSEPLVKSAVEIAQEEESNRLEQQNSIRDLALSVVEAGGSKEVVNGILQATDIDNAISMAAGALNANGKLKVEQIGSQLVQYDPNDPEGTARVIFNGGGSTGGSTTMPTGGYDSTGGFDFNEEKMADVKVTAKKMFAPEFANRVISELTDEELRLFLNDYTEEVNSKQMNIAPEQYYQEWKQASGLDEGASTGAAVTNPFTKK